MNRAAIATAGVIAAPYLLPPLGIGPSTIMEDIMTLCRTSGEFGSGLAGTLNEGMNAIPGIGPSLAAGGWINAAVSGGIGLGGVYLGNYISKHYDKPGHIPWGKIIKYAAITTSLLIALPSILSGISMGLTFLALLAGGLFASSGAAYTFASTVNGAVSGTLGLMGNTSIAAATAGFAGTMSHLLTCGAITLPFLPMMAHKAMNGGEQKPNISASNIAALLPPAYAQPIVVTPPPAVELLQTAPTVPGKPCNVAFRLRDAVTGRVLSPADIETTHTEKLHTMIVDRALNDYHHIHPHYDPASGLFVAQFIPRSNQPYMAWNEFTPTHGSRTTAHMGLANGVNALPMPPSIAMDTLVSSKGITADLSANTPLIAGADNMLNITLHDSATGQAVQGLQPVMGAVAHLVAFTADGQSFIHCHATGEKDGVLSFHIRPEQAGATKFFLQLKHQGQEVIIPFGQRVQAPQQFTAREGARPPQSHTLGHA